MPNLRIPFKYVFESYRVISQGYRFNDKLALLKYYLRTPIFLLKSFIHKKNIIEIEQQYKILSQDITIKNKHGIFFCGNNIMTVYAVVEDYEKEYDPYFKLSEGIFLDVGSHIGKYSIRIANSINTRGKVIAIEPDVNNFKLLCHNKELNQLNNLHCINKGAYSKQDELILYTTPHNGEMYNSLVKKQDDWKEVKIKVNTIDNILDELSINHIDLMKIDTEGVELEVVKGAINIISRCKPKIIVEVWGSESLKEIESLLSKVGYPAPAMIDKENYFFKF